MNVNRPTLLINKQTCIQNIEVMQSKAERNHLRFRPHFKTHQSHEIGRWFREKGVSAITVSSVLMAEYFILDGWNDITIAIPFNHLEINNLNLLTEKANVNIVVDSLATIEKIGVLLARPTGVYLKISTGYQRSGINSNDTNRIDRLLENMFLFPNFLFKGFLTHAGHTYEAKSKYEVQNIHFDALKKMEMLKKQYSSLVPGLEVSIGDTPSCSLSENFMGVDEIRPGNFIFYDLMQHSLGACRIDDIAIRLACPVVSKQRLRNEIVIYGGAIHLSKDSINNTDGKPLYGRVVVREEERMELLDSNNYVCKLTQEHGCIRCNPKVFDRIKIGDIVEIIPVHACLTAYNMGRYLSTKGEWIEMMPRF
jgi:D-serine deaminase-like pyridoxal phosphate-dependent protein